MRIIPRNVLDLKPGLALARTLDQRLQKEWEPRLVRWREIQARVKPRHLLGELLLSLSVLVGVLFFCGLLSVISFRSQPSGDYSAYIILSSVMAVSIGLLAASIVVKRRAKKLGSKIPAYKRAPEVSGLTMIWWQELEAEARRIDQRMAKSPKYGDIGELLLIEALKNTLPDSYFAVRSWKGVENLDNDVLVFGPNGIWILESKYWSGTVTFDGNNWIKRKTYYLKGGIPQTKEEVEKPIHKQWKSESDILYKILRTEMPGWRFKIEGGLVFTHPEVELNIDREKGCPVSVGKINGWIKKIQQTPVDSAMSEGQILMALDILMTYSRPFFDDPACRSVYLAERAYYRQVQMFIQWRRGK